MKKLMIPEKITLEREALPGIRYRDLPILAAIALPGVIAAVIVWSLTDRPLTQLVTLVAVLLYLFFCYAAAARVEGAQSMLDWIARLFRFLRAPRCFYFKEKEALTYASGSDGTGISGR